MKPLEKKQTCRSRVKKLNENFLSDQTSRCKVLFQSESFISLDIFGKNLIVMLTLKILNVELIGGERSIKSQKLIKFLATFREICSPLQAVNLQFI
jgi:hypothetical protein